MIKIIEPNHKWAYALTTRRTTTHLVIHHAAGNGPVEGIHNYHLSKGWAGIAYHYYVRKDGTIYRGRPENMTGGHTTNWNWCSIGICFEGNFEQEYMSDAQFEAGRQLIADIVRRYPSITVWKHSSLQQTSCPGRNFPFDLMLDMDEPSGSAEDSGAPSEWAKEACERMVAAGLFEGDEDENYRWHDNIIREEVAVLIDRLVGYIAEGVEKT